MTTRTNSRRSLLSAALGLTAAGALPAAAKSDIDQIQESANGLAVAMASRHGGTWEAHVDHDSGFVLISPRPAKGGAQ